jgi:hypothetical protein
MVLDPVLVSDPLELLMLLVGNMGPVAPWLEEVVAAAAEEIMVVQEPVPDRLQVVASLLAFMEEGIQMRKALVVVVATEEVHKTAVVPAVVQEEESLLATLLVQRVETLPMVVEVVAVQLVGMTVDMPLDTEVDQALALAKVDNAKIPSFSKTDDIVGYFLQRYKLCVYFNKPSKNISVFLITVVM